MVEPSELQDLDGAWERLATHLEWADGFWLVFLFTNDPRVVAALRERSESLLAGTRSFRAWRCSSPAEVDAMVDSILTDEPVDVHWIDLVRFDDRRGQPGWGDAWARLLHRLNERRELLRRRAPEGGLVFASTLDRLDVSPGLAPDLWTIRSLVFCVESLPVEREGEVFEASLARATDERERGSGRNIQLARQAVEAARERGDESGLARALTALADAAEGDEGVVAAQEAVELYRKLAVARPDVYMPNLARSLKNLGIRLSPMGRREEALAATQEAVEHYRELVKARPDAFLPDLAMALNSLGIHLSLSRRREEALAATQEALKHNRELAKARPDALLPDLARTLNNYGVDLIELGRREEALAATQEAVDIRKELAMTRPDAFLPDLARSLGLLGVIQRHVGANDESLESLAEAMRILLPFYLKLRGAHQDLFELISKDIHTTCTTAGLAIPADLREWVEKVVGGPGDAQ